MAWDFGQAVAWYRKAAQQGDAFALNDLGVMCREGVGTGKNGVLAYAYFNIAAALGHKKAAENREQMASKLTDEQIREGLALSSGWTPRTKLLENSGE